MNEIRTEFINRELGWIDFNKRVLEEAMRTENPIMERLRFLAITASNLDEFFMVRVAGVRRKVCCCRDERDESGYTPRELLHALEKKLHAFFDSQYQCLERGILPKLKDEGFVLLKPKQMTKGQRRFISEYFESVVFPILTPVAAGEDRQFPPTADRSLNIAIRLKKKGKDRCDFAVVKVPSNIPRVLELPKQDGMRAFALLEDIIMYKADSMFGGYHPKACEPFRIIRNSDIEIDDDAPDLLEEVKKSIKERKAGKPIRLELLSGCDAEIRNFLIGCFRVKKSEIYKSSGPIDLTVLTAFCDFADSKSLIFEPIKPVCPPADFRGCDDIFECIRSRDRFVHHPYESFECVVDFLNTAADDENVLAIKQTLYRVSGNSPIVAALIKAAQNGKQVTVLVELKARFDEENNVGWAQKLENAGCTVIYGIPGLKTHCKILSVIRREGDRLRTYIHLATGNYNDRTARLYTDMGMFTCRREFARDSAVLFNMLTGYAGTHAYKRFVTSPNHMRGFFEERINAEIANAASGKPCGICAKVNSLVDTRIISLLYKASCQGVPITLIVRGICCLIPQRKNLSENIRVYSIVGQLLEHSRIFRFENGGDPKIWIGSADWMPRNLDRRIELVFPVMDKRISARIDKTLKIMLSDNYNLREMQPDGSYIMRTPDNGEVHNSQRELRIAASEAQLRAERDLKRR